MIVISNLMDAIMNNVVSNFCVFLFLEGPQFPLDAVNSRLSAAALAMTPRAEQLLSGRTYSSSPHSSQPNRPPSVGNINSLQCAKCPYIASSHVDYQHHFYVAHHRVPSPNTSRITLPTKRTYETAVASHISPTLPISSQKYTNSELPCYHCPFCAWQCEINQGEAFNNHMNKHYSNPRYCTHMCSYCSREFSEPAALREHIFMHPLLHHYVCAICNIAFSTPELINQHMTQKHRKLENLGLNTGRLSSPRSAADIQSRRKLSDDSSSISQAEISRISDKTSINGDDRDRSSVHSPRPDSNQGLTSSRLSDRTTDTPLTVLSDSPAPSPSQPKRPRQQMMTATLGQTIAQQIQAAISKELIDVKEPTVGSLLFMKGPEPAGPDKRPLNLMSLLDRVVEQSLRNVPTGAKPEKPDLKFTVTFSDDEDAGGVECDSTAPSNGEKSATDNNSGTETTAKGKESPISSPPSTELSSLQQQNGGKHEDLVEVGGGNDDKREGSEPLSSSEETVTSSSLSKPPARSVTFVSKCGSLRPDR